MADKYNMKTTVIANRVSIIDRANDFSKAFHEGIAYFGRCSKKRLGHSPIKDHAVFFVFYNAFDRRCGNG